MRGQSFSHLTVLAEASVVPGAVLDFQGFCVHVQVLAVLVVALAKSLEEVADGHLGHVVLVEKLTLVSLLAQVAEPVLAHHSSLSPHVAKGAVAAPGTHAIQEELAECSLVF